MSIDNLVKREKIDAAKEIAIPPNARYIRRKSGYAFFFINKSSSKNNGFIEIPENVEIIIFPDYREHGNRHIEYGEHYFKSKVI